MSARFIEKCYILSKLSKVCDTVGRSEYIITQTSRINLLSMNQLNLIWFNFNDLHFLHKHMHESVFKWDVNSDQGFE